MFNPLNKHLKIKYINSKDRLFVSHKVSQGENELMDLKIEIKGEHPIP